MGDHVSKHESNAEELVAERRRVYGDPEEGFIRVAQIWSGILDTEVNATDVALCMIGYKLLRTQVCPTYSDNSDDIDGYLNIFRKIVGEDMVHARTVEEYLRQTMPTHINDHAHVGMAGDLSHCRCGATFDMLDRVWVGPSSS